MIKSLGNVSCVREDFGDLIVLNTVQSIVDIVPIRLIVIIVQMDGMVLLVISSALITAEKVDLVTKSVAIAMRVPWAILVTCALKTVVNIVTKLKVVTRKMELAKNARPVEVGHIVQKCAASIAKI